MKLTLYVFQGIEALENWVDPNGIPSNDGTNLDQAQIPPIEPIPAEPPALKPAPTAAPAAKPVICKKGKCKPYDPTKDKVSHFIFHSNTMQERHLARLEVVNYFSCDQIYFTISHFPKKIHTYLAHIE